MNEAETRVELIDPAARAAGWGVNPFTSPRLRGEESRKLILDSVTLLG